jgi:glycosyltransferase involved in cell wall biosynthesis
MSFDKNSYRQQSVDIEVLKKYKISKPFIFTVGRLERKKNTASLIRAFDLIKKQVDCQLVLAGQPGSGFEEIKQALSTSPNQTDIIRPGWVAKEDLPKLMAAAEVFAFPSLYEGFGIPVLEAMACGCPVVASRGNSLEEVGGEIAVYINPSNVEELASAIARFLTDKTYRQERSLSGLQRVENFDWSKTGAATWEALKKLSK